MEFKSTTVNNESINNTKKEEVYNMSNNNTKNTIESINVNFAIVFAVAGTITYISDFCAREICSISKYVLLYFTFFLKKSKYFLFCFT